MPQVTVESSVVVKENQADVTPTAEVQISFKDGACEDYNGPIRLKLEAGKQKVINIDHLSNLRILVFKRLSGGTWRLALRKSATETTDLAVERYFSAELSNVEHIKLTAVKGVVEIQVELVGVKSA